MTQAANTAARKPLTETAIALIKAAQDAPIPIASEGRGRHVLVQRALFDTLIESTPECAELPYTVRAHEGLECAILRREDYDLLVGSFDERYGKSLCASDLPPDLERLSREKARLARAAA